MNPVKSLNTSEAKLAFSGAKKADPTDVVNHKETCPNKTLSNEQK